MTGLRSHDAHRLLTERKFDPPAKILTVPFGQKRTVGILRMHNNVLSEQDEQEEQEEQDELDERDEPDALEFEKIFAGRAGRAGIRKDI